MMNSFILKRWENAVTACGAPIMYASDQGGMQYDAYGHHECP